MGLSRDDAEVHIVNPSVFQSYPYDFLSGHVPAQNWILMQRKQHLHSSYATLPKIFFLGGIVGYAERVGILTDKFHEV